MKLHKVLANKLLFLCVTAFFFGMPVFAQAEEIELFESTIEVQQDGSFVVTEKIIYDFGGLQRHGFFRDIFHRHPQEASTWYKSRTIDVAVESVLLNDQPEPYTLETGGEKTLIKIGHSDRTITGEHVYTISYRVVGGLSYLDSGEVELYWNATGNNWPVSIQKAVVILRDPVNLLLNQKACYEGMVRSITACTVDTDSENNAIFVSTNLAPGAGLTFAQRIDPSMVAVSVVESIRWFLLVPIGFLLLAAAALVRWWRFRFFYKPEGPVISQYEPYQDALPMYTGVLYDNRLDGRDITAGILHLAQQSFIKIKKTDKKILFFIELDDYEVTLLKESEQTNTHTHFEQEVLGLLFPNYTVGKTVRLSEIKNDQKRQRENYKKLQKLKQALRKDLIGKGFFEQRFGFLRRTKKGYDALWHLKGFREFLSVTDKERFTFHNAPSKSPEQFMQYLPYAVAFGVEKKWAEAFKDMVIEQPDWYEGGNVGTLSAVSAAQSLSAFSTAVNTASGSGYTSSSSASGGGGFSGGGGGGGGGGSW